MATIAVLLADGFEEIEAITIIDVLRRAGLDVQMVGVAGREVKGSHAITVRADTTLPQVQDRPFDAVVLPGGMPGARTLRDNTAVQSFLKQQSEKRALIAAICAAPIALAKAGLLAGKRATCFPGFEQEVAGAGARLVEETVVEDGRVLTSRGPGTAMAFGLAVAARFVGEPKARELAKALLAG